MTEEIEGADLFCGAGGSSEGCYEAVEELSIIIKRFVAINHDKLAVETYRKNHPTQIPPLCVDVDQVKPWEAVPSGHLDILIASPECIFHSNARGGKPVNDQRRASAYAIHRWCEALHVDRVLVENVPEFMDWGPLDDTDHPIKTLKGKIFLAFIETFRAMGYYVDYRVLVCADYGDATTRRRFFMLARKDKPIVWPEPSHQQIKKHHQANMIGDIRKPWRPAREIIDWSVLGSSVFNREADGKKPLVPNTMRRIFKGLEKFSGLSFVLGQQSQAAPRSTDQPIPTVAQSGNIQLVQPFLMGVGGPQGSAKPASVDQPLGTVMAQDRRALINPYLVQLNGQSNARDVDQPVPTITASEHIAVVQPSLEAFLVKLYGSNNAADVNQPLPTVTAKGQHLGVAQPFLTPYHGASYVGGDRSNSVDEPLPVIDTSNRYGLVQPFVMDMAWPGGHDSRVNSVDDPFSTFTSFDTKGLVQPFLMPVHHGTDGRSWTVDGPVPTITAFDGMGLVQPFLVRYNATGVGQTIDEPLATVTSKDRFGLVVTLVDGTLAILDIFYRMLMPSELAAATSFPKHYWFPPKREVAVRQIGNAVPVRTAKALCKALFS